LEDFHEDKIWIVKLEKQNSDNFWYSQACAINNGLEEQRVQNQTPQWYIVINK